MTQTTMALLRKHAGGRPRKNWTDEQYMSLLRQYQTSTAREMAGLYNVSYATMCRWLRAAREHAATYHAET